MNDPLKPWGLFVLLISLFFILVLLVLYPYSFLAWVQPIHLPVFVLAALLLWPLRRFRRSLLIIWWRKRLLNWQMRRLDQRIHQLHHKVRHLDDRLFQNDLLSKNVRHEGERTISLWKQQIKLLHRMMRLLEDYLRQLDGLRQDILLLAHLKRSVAGEPKALLSMEKVQALRTHTRQKINRRLLPQIRALQNGLHPATHQDTLDQINVQLTALETAIQQPELSKNN